MPITTASTMHSNLPLLSTAMVMALLTSPTATPTATAFPMPLKAIQIATTTAHRIFSTPTVTTTVLSTRSKRRQAALTAIMMASTTPTMLMSLAELIPTATALMTHRKSMARPTPTPTESRTTSTSMLTAIISPMRSKRPQPLP